MRLPADFRVFQAAHEHLVATASFENIAPGHGWLRIIDLRSQHRMMQLKGSSSAEFFDQGVVGEKLQS